MAKNILIFSDGTGQAGGLRPDQRLSNIYKLYRATRIGPDSPIDPKLQMAFYDAGLGSADDVKVSFGIVAKLRSLISMVTGYGISRNVVECYMAILKYYEPGDRIYLFGFSRGAYTVRSVAGVLNRCGVPTHDETGKPLPRSGSALRRIAEEAVHKVYEHGAGRNRATYDAQREELGRRFRVKYSSDLEGRANVVPYFIGVFDTVAALGAPWWIRLLIVVGAAWAGYELIIHLADQSLWISLPALLAASHLGWKFISARLKYIRNFPQDSWLKRFHFAGWGLKHYDKMLDRYVRYGRHALSIDENRKAFARVPWGPPKGDLPLRGDGEPPHLRQVWFAGNHSDIGGSYSEDESRLSDIPLHWMLEQVEEIESWKANDSDEIDRQLLVNRDQLNLFPDAGGMQHCEITAVIDNDLYPHWWPQSLRPRWASGMRGAAQISHAAWGNYHDSVFKRLNLTGVSKCGVYGLYRPAALAYDPDLVAQYPDLTKPDLRSLWRRGFDKICRGFQTIKRLLATQ